MDKVQQWVTPTENAITTSVFRGGGQILVIKVKINDFKYFGRGALKRGKAGNTD